MKKLFTKSNRQNNFLSRASGEQLHRELYGKATPGTLRVATSTCPSNYLWTNRENPFFHADEVGRRCANEEVYFWIIKRVWESEMISARLRLPDILEREKTLKFMEIHWPRFDWTSYANISWIFRTRIVSRIILENCFMKISFGDNSIILAKVDGHETNKR